MKNRGKREGVWKNREGGFCFYEGEFTKRMSIALAPFYGDFLSRCKNSLHSLHGCHNSLKNNTFPCNVLAFYMSLMSLSSREVTSVTLVFSSHYTGTH